MFKPSRVSLIIIIIFLILILTILITYISINDVTQLKKDITERDKKLLLMEQKLIDRDFGYTTATMEIDNLEQIILDKDDLIMELQVKEDMLVLYKEMLLYCVTYIQYIQTDMIKYGLDYPKFIIDSVLTEEFFEDIKEQEEIFEEN